jgi:hypothetical protein
MVLLIACRTLQAWIAWIAACGIYTDFREEKKADD